MSLKRKDFLYRIECYKKYEGGENMYSQYLKNKLNKLKEKVSFIEIVCKYDVSFNSDIVNNELIKPINETIDLVVEINEDIKQANTFNRFLQAFFETSNFMADILIEIVEAFENKNMSKKSLENLINEFQNYKNKLEDVIDNSINDITNVYYEIVTIGKSKFNKLYFTNNKQNINLGKQTYLYELENCKIDVIVIDSIKEDKIREILINENYNPKTIFSQNEIKIDIPKLINREISSDEYGILHLNLKKIELEYYLQFKNLNVSIISNNCWGGYLYQKSGMEYSSPLLWTYVQTSDFIKLVGDLKYYFKLKLKFIKEEDKEYPIAFLGDVKIYFQHCKTEEEARNKWYRRLKRVNYEDIIIQANVENYSDAIKFDNMNFKNKIALTPEDYNLSSCVYLSGWQKDKYDCEKYKTFSQYCHLRSWEYIDMSRLING
ncbi:DUF1919 domain-containing protein [Clostridium hydrogenum]|uniref:DUF1919 domain-containing protein n=1 Tax=Clostridium hydrogenum TaxID=2855764 RepID=UPI001F2CBB38|nr:DUF1919 domain-containing protein [Clostridium hydrogenum]